MLAHKKMLAAGRYCKRGGDDVTYQTLNCGSFCLTVPVNVANAVSVQKFYLFR